NAVEEYAAAYKKAQIPAQFYPSIGLALIYYTNYVMYMSQQNTQNSKNSLAVVQPLIIDFFNQGIALQQTVTSALQNSTASLEMLQSALESQENLIAWQAYIDQVVYKQTIVVQEILPTLDPASVQLITKNILTSGATIFSFAAGPTSITL